MRNLAFAALVLGAAGCAGSGSLYPDTDVVEPVGFEIKVATGVVKSGGLMQSGTLEYAGAGELTRSFRDYVASMRVAGWTSASDEIGVGKAVGVLRKDNRSCALEFVSQEGQLRAVIKVAPAK